MQTLPTVIGPAPSELSHEAFLEKLRKERQRVKEALSSFREKKRLKVTEPKKKRATPKTKGVKMMQDLASSLGISEEELLTRMEKLTKEE